MSALSWQDIRLIAGEGKLSAQTVLDAANTVLRARESDAADRSAALESALRECADELEASVRHEYLGRTFPAALPKYEADMQPVVKARALLDGGDHAR